ncbi:MAG: zinc metallopeptidase [Coriobacteriales bacterium]|nr:zinc metallopeptidase [Coriobacteriales bacterium]MBQ6586745.1 zinc metallopeptidase [Coriobacteriales bacterium]
MGMGYILLMVVSVGLGLATQAFIKSQYNKWSRVGISTMETGAQAARRMLDANGLYDVRIQPISGTLTDNYSPKTRVLSLSQGVYSGRSVASTAVACHEAGHALQHASNYAPLTFRTNLVPAVNLASNLWIIVFILGFSLNSLGLVYVGLALFAIAVLFQLVTLPVEFDASNRALAFVDAQGLPTQESSGAKSVLKAAALTYVAAALTSILQLLYFMGLTRE